MYLCTDMAQSSSSETKAQLCHWLVGPDRNLNFLNLQNGICLTDVRIQSGNADKGYTAHTAPTLALDMTGTNSQVVPGEPDRSPGLSHLNNGLQAPASRQETYPTSTQSPGLFRNTDPAQLQPCPEMPGVSFSRG